MIAESPRLPNSNKTEFDKKEVTDKSVSILVNNSKCPSVNVINYNNNQVISLDEFESFLPSGQSSQLLGEDESKKQEDGENNVQIFNETLVKYDSQINHADKSSNI